MMENYVEEDLPYVQYVELAGIFGIFFKVNLTATDEESLEELLRSFQQQIRVIAREEKKGNYLNIESYVRSTDRILKKARPCECKYCDLVFHCRADLIAHHGELHAGLPLKTGKKVKRRWCAACSKLVVNLPLHLKSKHGTDVAQANNTNSFSRNDLNTAHGLVNSHNLATVNSSATHDSSIMTGLTPGQAVSASLGVSYLGNTAPVSSAATVLVPSVGMAVTGNSGHGEDCKQCGEQNIVSLADHAKTCRMSPVCPDCNKTFSQLAVMNKHRRVVHMGMKIACNSCDNTYHDAQSLKKHVEAVHLKIKKICPLCGVTVSSLSVHMYSVHTGNKNFQCTDCEKKFKSNYDLNRHRDLVHLGSRPTCPYCGKHLANLRQHIRLVHKQIRFPCPACDKQLTTKSELRKHVAKAHPGTNPDASKPSEGRNEHVTQSTNNQKKAVKPEPDYILPHQSQSTTQTSLDWLTTSAPSHHRSVTGPITGLMTSVSGAVTIGQPLLPGLTATHNSLPITVSGLATGSLMSVNLHSTGPQQPMNLPGGSNLDDPTDTSSLVPSSGGALSLPMVATGGVVPLSAAAAASSSCLTPLSGPAVSMMGGSGSNNALNGPVSAGLNTNSLMTSASTMLVSGGGGDLGSGLAPSEVGGGGGASTSSTSLEDDFQLQLQQAGKDFCDDQLIAQYLTKQNFTLPSNLLKPGDSLGDLEVDIKDEFLSKPSDMFMVVGEGRGLNLQLGGRQNAGQYNPRAGGEFMHQDVDSLNLRDQGQQQHQPHHYQPAHQQVGLAEVDGSEGSLVQLTGAADPQLEQWAHHHHQVPLNASLNQDQDDIHRSIQKLKQEL